MASEHEDVEYAEHGLETSYPALRLIATILRALAWVVLTIGAIGSLGLAVSVGGATDSAALGIVAFVGAVLLTAFQATILFAFSDLIFVFLDIEANTWDAAENTLQLLDAQGRERRPSRVRRR